MIKILDTGCWMFDARYSKHDVSFLVAAVLPSAEIRNWYAEFFIHRVPRIQNQASVMDNLHLLSGRYPHGERVH
jgi:hypothetical protein